MEQPLLVTPIVIFDLITIVVKNTSLDACSFMVLVLCACMTGLRILYESTHQTTSEQNRFN